MAKRLKPKSPRGNKGVKAVKNNSAGTKKKS